jgi:hypothetical protein
MRAATRHKAQPPVRLSLQRSGRKPYESISPSAGFAPAAECPI